MKISEKTRKGFLESDDDFFESGGEECRQAYSVTAESNPLSSSEGVSGIARIENKNYSAQEDNNSSPLPK